MVSSLTPFGLELAKAVATTSKGFDTSYSLRKNDYAKNIVRTVQLRSLVRDNSGVLIAGAGKISDVQNLASATKLLLRSGVNWTNFNPDIDIQVLCSTHALALEAALFSSTPPLLMIHGVYSKVPPCISRSMTLRWSDPFMSPEFGDPPTPVALEEAISVRGNGPSPYIPAVKNVVFLNSMAMIWLGAKNIVFAGIDPLQPEYFFADNPSVTLELVRAITKANPWIAEWDGRNERIPERHRDSTHRRVKVISNLLASEGSGVGSIKRLKTMQNGFKLLLDYCKFKEVNVSYIGKSQFLSNLGLPRIA